MRRLGYFAAGAVVALLTGALAGTAWFHLKERNAFR